MPRTTMTPAHKRLRKEHDALRQLHQSERETSNIRYRLFTDEQRKVASLSDQNLALQREVGALKAACDDLRRQLDASLHREHKFKGFVEGLLFGMGGKTKLPKAAKLPWHKKGEGR